MLQGKRHSHVHVGQSCQGYGTEQVGTRKDGRPVSNKWIKVELNDKGPLLTIYGLTPIEALGYIELAKVSFINSYSKGDTIVLGQAGDVNRGKPKPPHSLDN
jgi:hypothetical protein